MEEGDKMVDVEHKKYKQFNLYKCSKCKQYFPGDEIHYVHSNHILYIKSVWMCDNCIINHNKKCRLNDI